MKPWNVRSSWYIDVTTKEFTEDEAQEVIGSIISRAMEIAMNEGLITWYDLDCQVNDVEEE